MAAYNPYNVAASGQNLLETLLGADQAKLKGQSAVGEHKGEMIEEYQDESIAAQKTQEELMSKGRKGKWWEKVLPIAGMFMGPMGSAILGGLQGMYTAKQQSKHALGQIGAARGAGVDVGKWGNTFLGSGARETKAASDLMFDSLTRDAQVSDMGLLKSGLTSGITSYAMGKMGEGVMEGVKGGQLAKSAPKLEGAELLKAPTKAEMTAFGPKSFTESKGLPLDFGKGEKFLGVGKGYGDYSSQELEKLFSSKAPILEGIFGGGGLGKDMSQLLEQGGTGQNSMASILAMLGLTQQGDQ